MTNSPAILRDCVHYEDDDVALLAHVSRPATDSPLAAVLIGPDWSGIHDGLRDVADRIARLGYAAFVADVYGGGLRGDPLGDNAALMDPWLADRAGLRRRMLAAIAMVAAQPYVVAERIGALGFCFGGLCVLDLARAAPPLLRASISVHGVLSPPQLGPQGPIAARVLVLHGWEDPVAPPPAVLDLATELTAAGADWQLHAYGHARHAFTFEAANLPERGILYDPRASKRAWSTIARFLADVLA